jgi:hypothetical protein
MQRLFAFVVLACSAGCASTSERHEPATAATRSLARGEIADARKQAESVLRRDPDNPRAAAVRALTRYERSMHQLSLDVRSIAAGGALFGSFNPRYLESALRDGEASLRDVDADLAVAAKDPNFSLDLCVACWEIDWNGNGRIDERDRLFFQIEQDADGNPIPEADPRRKPTFRFDQGDVYWARAFVAFQRAAIDLALAWDLGDLAQLAGDDGREAKVVRIRLRHPERVRAAREQLEKGLESSEQARQAYLAERDDEREWMPNPRQKDHPLPLPVDQALYDTWGGVVSDLQRLIDGKEGLDVRELVRLEPSGARHEASGYIDVGRLLREPKDIVIDLQALERQKRNGDYRGLLQNLFGDAYVRSMRPSPLPARLRRMKGEVDRGEESLERKLRYLLWVN